MADKKGRSLQEIEILKRDKELEYETDRLGPASLLTQQSHVSGSRSILENHHIGHATNIADPEPPLVASGFENVLGEQSSMLQYSDGDYTIVAKIVKNDYVYVLIGYDEKRHHYHAWEREELKEHFEGFATRYKNQMMDSLEPGDVIPKGEMIKTSESFDKYGNYMLGKNLNTVYLISLMVMEDGIALMNGADEKMCQYRSHSITVSLNDNEIFLNLYGKDGQYQGFPKIGEKIKDGILCATRTIDHSKAAFELKSKNLKMIEETDPTYYEHGRVIDMTIRYNKDIRDLPETPLNHDLLEYYRKQQKYYQELYYTMQDIIDSAYDEGYTVSDEFTIICEEAHKFVDATAFFSDRNDSVFGNMSIKFRIMNKEKMFIGSKAVGRFGNKGIISTIKSKEESYFTEDGRPIEAIVSALGVVGRLNPAQLNEHDLNDLGYRAVLMMKETDDLNEKGKIIYRLLKQVNSDESVSFRKYYKNLSDHEKEKFCKRVEKNGIYIVQDPVDNANIMDLDKAHEEFPPVWTRIVFPDGSKSLRKVICSKMYFIRLKQDPWDKYAARSRGPINPLYDLPSKSTRKKNHREPFADVAVRLGLQEIEVLLAMVPIAQVVADYMAENSTSTEIKRIQAKSYYMENPEDVPFDTYLDRESSNVDKKGRRNREIIYARAAIFGTKFKVKYRYPKEGKTFKIGGPREW